MSTIRLATGLCLASLALAASGAMDVRPARAGSAQPPVQRCGPVAARGTPAGSRVVNGREGGVVRSGRWRLEIPPGAFRGSATVSLRETTDADGAPALELAIGDGGRRVLRVPVIVTRVNEADAGKPIERRDPAERPWRQGPVRLAMTEPACGELRVPLDQLACVR